MTEEGGVEGTDGEDSGGSLMLTISGCPITLTGTLGGAVLVFLNLITYSHSRSGQRTNSKNILVQI